MTSALLVARVALAAVFAAAAAGKLLDVDRARRSIEGFGVSSRLAAPAALLLPLTELGVVVGLLVVDAARWAALAAVCLLVVFCAAILRLLARGETPECNCFGRLGSAPVGVATLARNGVVLLVAGFVVVGGAHGGGASAFAWATRSPALAVVASLLTTAVVLQALFSWQLFEQNGRLLARVAHLEAAPTARPDGRLPVGTPAPPFSLPDLEGDTVSLEDAGHSGRTLLLFFTEPGCALPAGAPGRRGRASECFRPPCRRDQHG